MMYASEIATAALRLSPVGTPHRAKDCPCAMCGRPIRSGDISSRLEYSNAFTDFAKLIYSRHVCGYCKATTPQTIMRSFQRAVITNEGVYNLNTDAARAWFWMTPPEPPYVFVLNHNATATFHYFWRTPVTLDSRVVAMNVDDVIYQVQRERVQKALVFAEVICAKSREAGNKRTELKTPFIRVARDPSKAAESFHGILSMASREFAKADQACAEAAAFLDDLSPGELIATSAFFKQKPETPAKPELVTTI